MINVESNNNEMIIGEIKKPNNEVKKSPRNNTNNNKNINNNTNNTNNNNNADKKWGLSFIFNILSNKKKAPVPKKRNNLVFRKISKAQQRQLNSTTWISLMQLGLWDNTTGPRVEAVWKGTEQ